MKSSVCSWPNCDTQIEIDDSFESTNTGKRLGISVVGWCVFHHKVYGIRARIFEKNGKGKNPSEVANDLFRYDKKEFNRITRIAERLVRSVMEV